MGWVDVLAVSPIPALLADDDPAVRFFVQRDLLDEDVGSVEALWQLPGALRLVRKQGMNGAWRYPKRQQPGSGNYDLLETFRNLRLLIDQYGYHRGHEATRSAAEYVFSCQSEEGDIRGVLGNQYMPYYHGVILELLITAGYQDDPRVVEGLEWLLRMRQDDGGWIVPAQAVPVKEKTPAFWQGEPLAPNRSRPFSHLATGMALRAFAVHPEYRSRPEARRAGELLLERFFQADKYNDRRGPEYWTKFQYPFWWPNLLTALDSLSLMGFPMDDLAIQKGLSWFLLHQEPDGLWPTTYGKGRDGEMVRRWVGLAVCRVFRRVRPELAHKTGSRH